MVRPLVLFLALVMGRNKAICRSSALKISEPIPYANPSN
jgi:hypothetical protein